MMRRCRPGTSGVEIDACAAPDLEFAGKLVGGETVHAAFMAALGDGYATMMSGDSFLTA